MVLMELPGELVGLEELVLLEDPEDSSYTKPILADMLEEQEGPVVVVPLEVRAEKEILEVMLVPVLEVLEEQAAVEVEMAAAVATVEMVAEAVLVDKVAKEKMPLFVLQGIRDLLPQILKKEVKAA